MQKNAVGFSFENKRKLKEFINFKIFIRKRYFYGDQKHIGISYFDKYNKNNLQQLKEKTFFLTTGDF